MAVAYAIALVIPLLVIAMKLLMAPELKKYYESRYQAKLGNAAAGAFEQALGELEASREQR